MSTLFSPPFAAIMILYPIGCFLSSFGVPHSQPFFPVFCRFPAPAKGVFNTCLFSLQIFLQECFQLLKRVHFIDSSTESGTVWKPCGIPRYMLAHFPHSSMFSTIINIHLAVPQNHFVDLFSGRAGKNFPCRRILRQISGRRWRIPNS